MKAPSSNTFADLVKDHCRFLLEAYGFRVERESLDADHFGNSIVVMRSGDVRIGFLKDRGVVRIDISPIVRYDVFERGSFDLSFVVRFLSPHAPEYNYIVWGEPEADTIIRVADILARYCVQLLSGKFDDWAALDLFLDGLGIPR